MLWTFCKFSSWLVAGWVEAAPSSLHSPAQASLQSEASWKVLQLLEFCNYFTSVEGKWALEMFKTRPSVHHSQLINWSNLFQRVATNLNISKPDRFYLWALYKALCDIKITRLLRLDRMKLSHFWVFMLIFNFIHCTGGRKMILKNSFMKNEKIRFYIWEAKGAILLHFPPVSNFIFILAVTTDCGCQMPCKIQIYGETLWQPGQFITGSEPRPCQFSSLL